MCPKCTTMIKTIHLNFENEIGILKKIYTEQWKMCEIYTKFTFEIK